jgi:hypothetical protein
MNSKHSSLKLHNSIPQNLLKVKSSPFFEEAKRCIAEQHRGFEEILSANTTHVDVCHESSLSKAISPKKIMNKKKKFFITLYS